MRSVSTLAGATQLILTPRPATSFAIFVREHV
jgi:hypothetical protein